MADTANTWNCCRTCLSDKCLNAIFYIPGAETVYTETILTITGVKVELNDNLPQTMCTDCIDFTNSVIKFRTKCKDAQETLRQCHNQQMHIKTEATNVNTEIEQVATINITLDTNSNSNLAQFVINSHFIHDNIKKSEDDDVDDDDDNMQEIPEFQSEVDLQNDDQKKHDVGSKKSVKTTRSSKTIRTKKKVKQKIAIENDENNQVPNKLCRRRKVVQNESIECEFCHKILTSKLSLRNHYKIHTGFDVICEHCGKKFISQRLLLMHCRARHGYEKTDKCSYCDYRASNAEQVKIHERLHTGEKPFCCSHCGAAFHRRSSYLQHVAIHLPEKSVQCDQCHARFKSVTLMRIHKNRHRQPQYSYKCYICNNSFARKRNVVRHLQRIHAVTSATHEIERVPLDGSSWQFQQRPPDGVGSV
ncbi:zinc finger protein 845 [Plutella xylostella]|uniref:zinc finger protein 845 n=1 Tax=Plutella xylostella TaxID=51655 RepID=UPI0020330367|nr:zinc finger protein 845 [Plutella xylostella]